MIAPAPWRAAEVTDRAGTAVLDARGALILLAPLPPARLLRQETPAEEAERVERSAALARLIAAAPDLLEALRRILALDAAGALLGPLPIAGAQDRAAYLNAARAALARAEGRAS